MTDRLPPALTLWRPWAELYLTHKTVENRGWNTTYRGPLLIHAGKHWDPSAIEFAGGVHECRGFDWHQTAHPVGIIGVVELTDVCDRGLHEDRPRCSCDNWAAGGAYHWQREDPHHFTQPIACAGRQGLWHPTGEAAEAVRAALAGLDDLNQGD